LWLKNLPASRPRPARNESGNGPESRADESNSLACGKNAPQIEQCIQNPVMS
jgi:hypothetical protein